MVLFLSPVLFFIISCNKTTREYAPRVEGELKQWHNVVLVFHGPDTGENDSINPFLRYRLNVTFSKGNKRYVIPGYYAADGNAAETGADIGNNWKVNFCPDDFGIWNYEVSFRAGKDIAVNDDPEAGEKIYSDGYKDRIRILPSDKTGRDFRAKGRLIYDEEHYLRFSGTGEPFLKGGSDSPEDFLGYQEFDGTYFGAWNDSTRAGEAKPNKELHRYLPHMSDWKEGNPVWRTNKGKGIIGALNYLASKGMNSVYMLTDNVGGDGKDVFPWTTYNSDFTRFDVSKLEQWEIVFNYMDQLGLMCHFVTQENENQLLLDSGKVGLTRKLYYRELIARFSHHLAVTWNLGEENGPSAWADKGQTGQERREMAIYFKTHDPYKNFIAIHTHSGKADRDKILEDLLGFPSLDGTGLQTMPYEVHNETIRWRIKSSQKGRNWIVSSDEIGPADTGAKPDTYDPFHDLIRRKVLWGNLMAGGAGVEWYFGYNYPNNDLNCEDWRSRDNLWNQTRIALDFFHKFLPFSYMKPADELVMPDSAYCLAAPDSLYALYIPENAGCRLHINTQGSYATGWFDPRAGGSLVQGDTVLTDADGVLHIQNPVTLRKEPDWAVLIKKIK